MVLLLNITSPHLGRWKQLTGALFPPADGAGAALPAAGSELTPRAGPAPALTVNLA